MNLFLNLLVSDIIKLLEEQFILHETELQEAFLNEVGLLSQQIAHWLTAKLSGDAPDEEK